MLFSEPTNFWMFFFQKKCLVAFLSLIHPLSVVFVFELPQHLEFAIRPEQGDIGMRDAVEHIGLHGGIVQHIFKNDALAHLQFMIELPEAHVVAAETTVTT